MRRLLVVWVVWAVLVGAVLQGWPLLAATGGSATAEDTGADAPRRHRCSRPAKQLCGALDKEEEQWASCQHEHW